EPLPSGAAKTRSVQAMFDVIAPRYDLVNRLMTFRMDGGWRRRAAGALALPPGSRVLDLASGTGDLAAGCPPAATRPRGATRASGCPWAAAGSAASCGRAAWGRWGAT